MGCELLNRLRGTKAEECERLKFGDELAQDRKKQSQPALQRNQLSQASRGRASRAGRQPALAPHIEPTDRVSRPPSTVSHWSRQSSQQQSNLLQLRVQQLANMRPGHGPLQAPPDDGWHDPPMPTALLMEPPTPPMGHPVVVYTLFVVGGYMKDPSMKEVRVRGCYVPSFEHSLVSSSLAAMGKRGIETGLPLPSHGTSDMADMTVVVPVASLDGHPPTKNVDIRARVDYDLEGYNYILGRRAYHKMLSVQNGLPSASPGGPGSFGHSDSYVVPDAANMSTLSPPPSSAYTDVYRSSDYHPQANMGPGTAQGFPVSPFQDSLDHDMSTYDAPLNNTEMGPDAMEDPQTGPMSTGTQWAGPTFFTQIPELLNRTAPNPLVSGAEASGSSGHQDEMPDPVAQHELIRFDGMGPFWGPPLA